ncbi:unnamed protein product [Arctogadus glacialis]
MNDISFISLFRRGSNDTLNEPGHSCVCSRPSPCSSSRSTNTGRGGKGGRSNIDQKRFDHLEVGVDDGEMNDISFISLFRRGSNDTLNEPGHSCVCSRPSPCSSSRSTNTG